MFNFLIQYFHVVYSLWRFFVYFQVYNSISRELKLFLHWFLISSLCSLILSWRDLCICPINSRRMLLIHDSIHFVVWYGNGWAHDGGDVIRSCNNIYQVSIRIKFASRSAADFSSEICVSVGWSFGCWWKAALTWRDAWKQGNATHFVDVAKIWP